MGRNNAGGASAAQSSQELRYERMRIDSLCGDPDNPRTISDAAMSGLQKSVNRFGLVQPIVLNETTGQIVAGHQRLEALRRGGATDVMVVIGRWTPDEQRALNVTLNNPGIQGEFTNAAGYLDQALTGLSLHDFRELRLDAFFPSEPKKRNEAEPSDLSYRLLIVCTDEQQQADLLDEFTDRGLEVKPLIV